MQTSTKAVISIFSVIGWLFVISIGYFIYEVSWKETEIGTYAFGDTAYELRICEIGEADWPFGYAHCRMDFKKGKELVSSTKVDINNDGMAAHSGNFHVHWFESFIRVMVTNRGGINLLYDLYYDGTIEKTSYWPSANTIRQYAVDETAAGNTSLDKAACILNLELPEQASAHYTDTRIKNGAGRSIEITVDLYGGGTVQEQIEEKGTWNKLPMPEDFRALTEMAGAEWSDTDEELGEGYWYFFDRHKEASDRGDFYAAMDRDEQDFIAAVYLKQYGFLALYIYAS